MKIYFIFLNFISIFFYNFNYFPIIALLNFILYQDLNNSLLVKTFLKLRSSNFL